jgi:hypothetical protein
MMNIWPHRVSFSPSPILTSARHRSIKFAYKPIVQYHSLPSPLYHRKETTHMPTVRKLAPEEVQTIENKGKGLRKLIEEQYDRFLADYDVGDYGEAIVDEDEKRLTVRNRFKAAASRRGIGLHFLRTIGDVIRFKIISEDGNGTAEPPSLLALIPVPEPEHEPIASDAPPKRKGGRPKKAVLEPAPVSSDAPPKRRPGRPKRTAS